MIKIQLCSTNSTISTSIRINILRFLVFQSLNKIGLKPTSTQTIIQYSTNLKIWRTTLACNILKLILILLSVKRLNGHIAMYDTPNPFLSNKICLKKTVCRTTRVFHISSVESQNGSTTGHSYTQLDLFAPEPTTCLHCVVKLCFLLLNLCIIYIDMWKQFGHMICFFTFLTPQHRDRVTSTVEYTKQYCSIHKTVLLYHSHDNTVAFTKQYCSIHKTVSSC